MRFISKAGTTVSLGISGLLLLGAVQAKDAAPAVKVETISKSSAAWDGQQYQAYPAGTPEITVLRISIPAHSQLPWHTHPMPNTGYILSGELTLEKKDTGQKEVFKAGQAVNETIGEVHRGVTGDQPVELIVFYAGQKGMPLSEKTLP
ncbi:cupin domain-containing protein [Janthinobacterium agaricidamnosum]|uniref:Cupin domain protein n=1 Tax=Janthinobacterium agaricidamnosum NBRC 102515 = DSM 9628 TaxID=1349767 RepID=W0V284_9BURK|nr:cupin domain-containing protein [Janthinobacterium agaricidamnosum]CDG82929.1 cupin domain protein [Janthinobacterium agaricidamnosum NBRC 102515 = DSM 9628]